MKNARRMYNYLILFAVVNLRSRGYSRSAVSDNAYLPHIVVLTLKAEMLIVGHGVRGVYFRYIEAL